MKLIYHRGKDDCHLSNGGKKVARHAPGTDGNPICGAGRNALRYGWVEVEENQVTCPRCVNMKVFRQKHPFDALSLSLESEVSRRSTCGWVYLLRAESVGLYKIGYTAKLEARISQIQSCSPVSLQLVHSIYFSNAAEVEKVLHETFNPYRQHGEWFNLPESAVEWICSWGGKKDASN